MAEEKVSTNQFVIAVFVLIITYGLLFALNAAHSMVSEIPYLGLIFTIPAFSSPMFFAMPFFSFFAMFFLVDWVNKQFETKNGLSPLFPVVYFVLALFAYYVALYWYMANFAMLGNVEMTLEMVEFWPKLHGSAFMPFLWGGVFGWIARYAVEKIKF